MTKLLLAVLITSFLLAITTPFTAAFPFVGGAPEASSLRKRCLFRRFFCSGQTAEPSDQDNFAQSYVPAATQESQNNIVLDNNNEVTIGLAHVVPAYPIEQVETSTLAVFVTELAPVTFISSVTDSVVVMETLPAETDTVNNYETVTEVATAYATETDVATQTLPAETVLLTNYVTVNQQETVLATETDFATETLPAETEVVSNYFTVTNFETASVTESVFETETLPAQTVVSNNYETLTEVATVSTTEIDTETQVLPAQTVVVNNFYTVTEVQTASVIAFATPSPAPYSFLVNAEVPEAASCQACVDTPVCVDEAVPCT